MKKIILAAAALSFAFPAPAQAPAASDPTAFALALHQWVHAFPKTESGDTKRRSGGPEGGPV